MRRRSFTPALGESELEARISLSRAVVRPGGIPVVAFGSATNPGMFNGLVEKKVQGRWYNAVFFNGHRYSEWSPHPGGPKSPGSIYLLRGDTIAPLPRGHWTPKIGQLLQGRRS